MAPAIEFAYFPTQTFLLNDTSSFLPTQDPYGRAAFLDAVAMAGLDTNAGKTWHMELPPHIGDPQEEVTPALLYPGYPSVTELLYRQARRASSLSDSVKVFRLYSILAAGGDSAAAGKLSWLFKEPWGSSAWEDTLGNHGWTLDSMFAATGQFAGGKYSWYRAPEQMPELDTYLPDTAALELLAEWVRRYPAKSGIRVRPRRDDGAPGLSGRWLRIPDGWTGPVLFTDLGGRRIPLAGAGQGRFRIPDALGPGVYLLRIGHRAFRIPIF
jgi:hypothetical protein